jgi:hypothetical protein
MMSIFVLNGVPWYVMFMSGQQGHTELNDPNEDLTLLLLQKIWQGRLPTKVSLAANESKSFTNTPPLYVTPLNLPTYSSFNSLEFFICHVFLRL